MIIFILWTLLLPEAVLEKGDPVTPRPTRLAQVKVESASDETALSKDQMIANLRRRALTAELMVEELEERLNHAGAPVLHWVGPDAQLPDDFPMPKKGAIWKGLVHKADKTFCAACGQEIPEDKGDGDEREDVGRGDIVKCEAGSDNGHHEFTTGVAQPLMANT